MLDRGIQQSNPEFSAYSQWLLSLGVSTGVADTKVLLFPATNLHS